MNVDLPAALEGFVKDLVAEGRYADDADVVRDALRQMQDRLRDPGLAEVRNEIETGAPVISDVERLLAKKPPGS